MNAPDSTENFDSANILLKSKLYNPCLQNVQQAVEKALKALLIEKGRHFKKNHDILELKNVLKILNIEVDLWEALKLLFLGRKRGF